MPATERHSAERLSLYKTQFRKTKLCKYYANGICNKAENCKFAHGEAELSILPDLKKTALCQDFARGTCSLSAEQCEFAHGPGELRKSPAFSPKPRRGKARSQMGRETGEELHSFSLPSLIPSKTSVVLRETLDVERLQQGSWQDVSSTPGKTPLHEISADIQEGAEQHGLPRVNEVSAHDTKAILQQNEMLIALLEERLLLNRSQSFGPGATPKHLTEMTFGESRWIPSPALAWSLGVELQRPCSEPWSCALGPAGQNLSTAGSETSTRPMEASSGGISYRISV